MKRKKTRVIRDRLLKIGSDKDLREELGKYYAYGIINDVNMHPLHFLFGVIFDYQIPYKKAWRAPYELEERLRERKIPFNTKSIASMDERELTQIIRTEPSLHRYPSRVSNALIEAAKLVVTKYNSDPSNIWNDKPTAKQLESRFDEFKLVSQKKASMAVRILVDWFDIPISGDKSSIDISADRHVIRVLKRLSLIDKEEPDRAIQAARELNPEYPGALDFPAWAIGIKWCKPKEADCGSCTMNDICPKVL